VHRVDLVAPAEALAAEAAAAVDHGGGPLRRRRLGLAARHAVAARHPTIDHVVAPGVVHRLGAILGGAALLLAVGAVLVVDPAGGAGLAVGDLLGAALLARAAYVARVAGLAVAPIAVVDGAQLLDVDGAAPRVPGDLEVGGAGPAEGDDEPHHQGRG